MLLSSKTYFFFFFWTVRTSQLAKCLHCLYQLSESLRFSKVGRDAPTQCILYPKVGEPYSPGFLPYNGQELSVENHSKGCTQTFFCRMCPRPIFPRNENCWILRPLEESSLTDVSRCVPRTKRLLTTRPCATLDLTDVSRPWTASKF